MVTVAVEATDVVPTPKVADVEPAAMVTLAGTLASVLPLERLTTVAACAGALRVTVPCALAPPVTAVGLSVSAERVGPCAAGGVMLSTALCVEPPYVARIVTCVGAETDAVVKSANPPVPPL